ncbi:uncharacterized protein LOC136063846 [Quercus suber]|uniref:uncharacterized protein LOC136063846 n=1 Tax=Quercus suber TaxID=58331 RepID=UPI0032DF3330
MPTVREYPTTSGGKTDGDNVPMAICTMGIDIVGPLPLDKGQVKFLLVAIDYFTKWVEAEPLATITEAKIRSFVWKNIVCRFGIPMTIISDNGRQFDCQNFKDFCSGLGIKNQFSSPGHPQANGQTESIKPNKHGDVIVSLAQSSAVAILVIVDALDNDDVVFSLVVASVRIIYASEAEVLINEGISAAEVVDDDAVEPWHEFKLTT